MQRIFQQQFLKNHISDLAQIWELSLVCFFLCYGPILTSKQSNFMLPIIPP